MRALTNVKKLTVLGASLISFSTALYGFSKADAEVYESIQGDRLTLNNTMITLNVIGTPHRGGWFTLMASVPKQLDLNTLYETNKIMFQLFHGANGCVSGKIEVVELDNGFAVSNWHTNSGGYKCEFTMIGSSQESSPVIYISGTSKAVESNLGMLDSFIEYANQYEFTK